MMSTTKSLLFTLSIALLPTFAHAAPADATPTTTVQDSAQGVRVAPGEVLNFKTDTAPTAKDPAQVGSGYKFKDSTGPMPAPVTYNEDVNDDVGFKTYIGYPKHRFSVDLEPKNVAANWNYKGAEFNFRSSTTAYGLAYDLIATPRFGMGVDYSHYSLKVDDANNIQNNNIHASSENYDTYFIRTHYCFFGNSSFAIQYCPEFMIGNDAYPILGFTGSTDLRLDKVQDLVVGINMKFQIPITDRFLFHITPGYLMGTGIGNSGTLTSKNNSTLYGQAGVVYDFNSHNALGVEFNTSVRNAKLKGAIGNNTDESWTTKSTEVGGKVIYTYTL